VPTRATYPDHDRLQVICNRDTIPRTRKIFCLPGLSPLVDYRVHNNSIINLERAIRERVFNVETPIGFSPPPRPKSAQFFGDKLRDFSLLLKKKLRSTTPISQQQFVEMYEGRRRTIYQRAVESLQGAEVTQQDAELRAFVKAEKIDFTKKVDPAPRVIQPRNPRYNVEVGVYLKPIEHRVYKAIASIFSKSLTVVKGMNASEVGKLCFQKWTKFRNPVAIGLDASRFDQHVSDVALEWEHSIYLAMYNHDPKLKMLLRWQIDNKGRGFCDDGKLKYSVRGCRMSGDMNTALGNCLLMCAMVWSYCKDKGIDEFELMNNGDDCVVIIEQSQLHQFSSGLDSWFTDMGFTMKVEPPVYEMEKIEFCQTQPIYDGESYIMVRNPHKAIAKDCVSIKPLDTESAFKKYLTVFGQGGLSLTGGIPVWQDFYCGLTRSGAGLSKRKVNKLLNDPVMDTGMFMLAKRMSRLYRKPTPETRFSFWLAFGIDPSSQEALENYYQHYQVEYETPVIKSGDIDLPFWPYDC